MEMALNMGAFETMDQNELFAVDGGFDGDAFFTGVGILGAGLLAIVALPEAALVGAAYGVCCVGAAAVGAASGWFMGSGLFR